MFNGGTPFLLMGSVRARSTCWRTWSCRSAPSTVVPGHGPVFDGTAPIEATLDYLRFVLDARRARPRGRACPPWTRRATLTSAASPDWPDAERIVGNLHRAYAELDGTPRGGPIDVLAALADMVTYNGGKPLTCLA